MPQSLSQEALFETSLQVAILIVESYFDQAKNRINGAIRA
jgi:hypothetical protein